MRSIFLQYFKYGNVFIYLLEDGSIMATARAALKEGA